MKLSWQPCSFLLCAGLIVGCGEQTGSTVSDTGTPASETSAAPAPVADSDSTPAAGPQDTLLEGIELEDPAEYAGIKGAYEAAPTDSEAIQNYVGTLLNFAWAHAQRGAIDRSDESLTRAGKILLKAADDKVELPVLPESSLQAEVLYGYACVLGKTGNATESLAVLNRAVEVGFENLPMIKSDKDLAAVRELADFDTQVGVWEKHFEELKKKREEALVQHAKEDLANGETFPFDFDLTDVDGKPIRLADLKGRVCIIDIWGTWCPPCREEVPSFVKLQDEYGKYGLQVIGLNDERGPSEEANINTIKNFMADKSMNYRCALISEEVMAQLPEFKGYPTTLFVDHHGKVRLTAFGYHEYGYLKTVVEALLTERTLEARGTATN